MSALKKNEKKILCIGIVCVDIVVTVDKLPEEDLLAKGRDPHWQRGGNAANDCTLLSLLKCPCELLTTFATNNNKHVENNFYTQYVKNDMKEMGISYEHSVSYDDVHCPCSHVIITGETGNRTIIYNNPDLPEVNLNDFQKLNLKEYQWIHFEGRCGKHALIMNAIREWNASQAAAEDRIKISLEMELPHGEYEMTAPLVDFVFVSKELARERGLMTKEDAINNFWIPLRDDATLIFPWGDEGAAYKCGKDGSIQLARAYPPAHGVVDTLGAGDSFISSTFYALSRGHPIEKATDFGCRVAGYKVGIVGLRQIGDVAFNLYKQCFP